MIRSRLLTAGCLSLVLLGAAMRSADAQHGGYSGPWPNPFSFSYGFGFGGSPYGLGYVPVPPYFAIHPPVYYGERYARPYGESPFASPSLLQPNSRFRPERRTDFVPFEVANPYCCESPLPVSSPESPAASDGRIAHKGSLAPQLIENPFCRQVADANNRSTADANNRSTSEKDGAESRPTDESDASDEAESNGRLAKRTRG